MTSTWRFCMFLLFAAAVSAGPTKKKPTAHHVKMGSYTRAAIVANGFPCAKIGRDVLAENGTAVDAAIATLLCDGVINPQSMGLGGGFFMTIYTKQTRTAEVLNSRETAPAAATKDMFDGNPDLSQKGGLSIAVPAELRGYEEAYKRHGGGVPWARLFAPTIQICRNGFRVTKYIEDAIKEIGADVPGNEALSEILMNHLTNELLKEGDIMTRPRLADTLEIVAREGADALYNGSLTDAFIQDIQDAGGIITKHDLANYRPIWESPVPITFGRFSGYSAPLPASGAVLAFILNILDGFIPARTDKITVQRIVESFKFAYGRRTELGDVGQNAFVPDAERIKNLVANMTSVQYAEKVQSQILDYWTSDDPEYYGAVATEPVDHGTAHLCVLAPNGDAVSVTSTINLTFGSQVRSPTTGIIFNDEMDDFSSPNITNAFGVPPTPANYIYPGKRPLSSMAPAVFTDSAGKVQLVVGSAGGTKITSTVALLTISNLLFNNTIVKSIQEPRFHHQLFPMMVDYEPGFSEEALGFLRSIGHDTVMATVEGSTATGIGVYKDKVTASFDPRRGGSVSGF